LLPLIAFLTLALILYVRIFAGDPQILPSALIGKSVPEFSIPPLGKSGTPGLTTGDLRNGKMTLVNVFSSWCVPCREEHPLLMSLAFQLLDKQMPQAEFQLIGINYKDKPEAAQKFLQDNGNPFSKIGADESGRIAIDWGVYGVPESFIVDGSGRILFKHVGPLNVGILNSDILPLLRNEKK
jgi:cytochrome c biogenesis protein CcmG/thiol:disulfide interchange protein DsbE